jgi:PAS domain S-box-containing protein
MNCWKRPLAGRWKDKKFMSIRTKIGIILLCAVICFSVAEYCVQQFIILPGFFSLERDEAVKDTERVAKAINNEIGHLKSLCKDWSGWNDTYNFVQNGNSQYIESNLALSTFTNNNLNLIYICNAAGQVVWGKIYDIEAETELDLSLFPKDVFPSGHPLLIKADGRNQPEKDIKGLLITEAGPAMVSATPILTSKNEGPPWGTMIMGRFLNADMVGKIGEQTQVEFSLTPFSAEAALFKQEKKEEASYDVEIVDKDHLNVHSIFIDINGIPAITITTNFHRNISQKGYDTVKNGIYSILIAGMGILVLMMLSLKQSILNPIEKLGHHVFLIQKTGDLSKRLISSNNDEIGKLTSAFNDMVSWIQQSAADKNQINKQLRKDIDKRKQAEAALVESENRFRTMIEQAGDAVFLHDADGNFRVVNQTACERLGYEKSMLLNLSIDDIDPEAVVRGDKKKLIPMVNQNKPVVFETRHQRRDGTFIPVEVSLAPIKYCGESLILSIVRDMTERKLMDDQILQSHKMEAMTTLTAGIAHNFNNILSVIVGCTELAVARLPEDNQAVRLLKKVEDASARAKDIVWQLIRFSQKHENSTLPVRLVLVVDNEIRRMESSISNEVKIIRQLPDDCYPFLGDADQLGIMMQNLLSNAVESINNQRGVIEVQLENINDPKAANGRNGNLTTGKLIQLTIRDNGQGIDPAHLDRIFDPYFTTKDFSHGAGMGLSVVHGIVINNGGFITVDSKVGRGTEIRIFFPAAEGVNETAT